MIRTTVYVHSDKDSMWSVGEVLGLTGEALRMFRHACGEIEIGLDVDADTGIARIVSVDGRAIA